MMIQLLPLTARISSPISRTVSRAESREVSTSSTAMAETSASIAQHGAPGVFTVPAEQPAGKKNAEQLGKRDHHQQQKGGAGVQPQITRKDDRRQNTAPS